MNANFSDGNLNDSSLDHLLYHVEHIKPDYAELGISFVVINGTPGHN